MTAKDMLLKTFDYIHRTSYLARRIGEELQKKISPQESSELEITKKEILCLEVAGLCHDLGRYIISKYLVKM